MITVTGRMVVNTITGKYGEFNVAILYCDIGNYVVRYNALDEFSSGTYEGDFIICNTTLRTRDFGVGKIIEPIAYLEDMNLSNVDESEQESVPEAILDPIEEETDTATADGEDNLADGEKSKEENDSDDAAELFGELWPLQEKIKLDATVGRGKLRLQKDYLETKADYTFIAKHQIWIKNH